MSIEDGMLEKFRELIGPNTDIRCDILSGPMANTEFGLIFVKEDYPHPILVISYDEKIAKNHLGVCVLGRKSKAMDGVATVSLNNPNVFDIILDKVKEEFTKPPDIGDISELSISNKSICMAANNLIRYGSLHPKIDEEKLQPRTARVKSRSKQAERRNRL